MKSIEPVSVPQFPPVPTTKRRSPYLSFDISEYQERVRKVKARMEEEGVEVLLVSDPANMNYISGYDGWSFYVHQLLVLIIDEDDLYWVGRGQDANGAKLTTWFDSDNIIPYGDEYVHASTIHPMDFAAEFLIQIGQDNRTIGVEMDTYYFTAQCYERLKMGLPNAEFRDGSLLVNKVRIVKSDTEIEYMQKAARIVEKTMFTAIDSIGEGVRECDVAANVYHTQISGTEAFGGDYPAIVPLMPSGEKTSTPHLTWTDQRYKKGDIVILELAGCYRRYHTPMARTVVIGDPPPHVQELSDAVAEGLNQTLDAVKPGVTCEEVEQVWRRFIEKRNIKKDTRLGYSVGLNYPPDWGEHTASLRKNDWTVLEPNMTFHMIPGIWLNQYGMELSEVFRVTETGCEVFAQFPRKLFVK